MLNIKIRMYQNKDLKSIVLLIKELTEVAIPTHQINEANIKRIIKETDKYPEIYKYYIAECNNEVIGFMSLIFYKTVFHKQGIILINELIVKSNFRGKGVGKKLIEKAKELCTSTQMDELEVATKKTNTKARNFYKKCGFLHEYVLLGMDFRNPG